MGNRKYVLSLIIITLLVVFVVGCKKSNPTTPQPDNPPNNVNPVAPPIVKTALPITLPDSVMFAGILKLDSNKTTIYLLDARTGQLVTRYDYVPDGHSNFCKPFAGNGLLYDVERDKVNAITMNTGAVLWTDNVGMDTDEASIILHDDTFYGIMYNHTGTPGGTFVYALDATKQTTRFLWEVPIPTGGNVNNLPINYYNGTIYVIDLDGFRLAAFDAKTGIPKWTIKSSGSAYSLVSLNNGVIIEGHTIIDAVSGSPIATVKDPGIPPIAIGATQISSSVNYVTGNLYFVETTQAAGPLQQSFLSAIDRAGGVEKWRADFGSHIGNVSSLTAIDTTKVIRLSWNNKLIVEETVKTYSGISVPYGMPILTSITGGFKTLDISTGLFTGVTGGETRNAIGFASNDASIVVNNMMYGNYHPASGSGINVYATDLSTGQLKWSSKPLNYDGIYDVFTCVFSASQGKGYSPYTK